MPAEQKTLLASVRTPSQLSTVIKLDPAPQTERTRLSSASTAMWVLYLLSFVSLVLVALFGVICVACGLFFIAETVEVCLHARHTTPRTRNRRGTCSNPPLRTETAFGTNLCATESCSYFLLLQSCQSKQL